MTIWNTPKCIRMLVTSLNKREAYKAAPITLDPITDRNGKWLTVWHRGMSVRLNLENDKREILRQIEQFADI